MFLFRQFMLLCNASKIVCPVFYCPRVAENSVWKVRDAPALMFYVSHFRSLPSDGVCRLHLIYGIYLGERSFILVILLCNLPFISHIYLVNWKGTEQIFVRLYSKAFRAVLYSSLNVKAAFTSDKTVAAAASTLISLVAARPRSHFLISSLSSSLDIKGSLSQQPPGFATTKKKLTAKTN